MLHLVYFDLETKHSAEDVGGWTHIMDMGMSVGVLWDNTDRAFHVYLEHQTEELITHLRRAKLVVGFNHIKFDLGVLAGIKSTEEERKQFYNELVGLNHFDMLTELSRVLGYRLSLDSIARPTLQHGKSADGLQALEWYKTGQIDKIIEYCKQDVEVTRLVHEYALKHGELLYDSRSGVKTVKLQWKLEEPEPQAAQQMSLFE